MSTIAIFILIVSTASASIMLVLYKYEVFDLYYRLLPKWPDICYFCVGFWICVGVHLLLKWHYEIPFARATDFLICLCSASIVRKLTADVKL